MSKKVSLFIEDGLIEIEINNDPKRIFKFATTDINQFDKFLDLQMWANSELKDLLEELSKATVKIKDNGELDMDGYLMGRTKELGQIVCNKLDNIFGAGTSEAVFAGVNPLSPTTDGILLETFIKQITPILEDGWKQSGVLATSTAKVNKAGAQALLNKKAQAQAKRK